jgi:pimeloyl-ACP methyl ester carboxylesterase
VQHATALNVTVLGEGEPVVFVHGSFGWGQETWRMQRPLADSYLLLLVDRRGFGGTPSDGRVDFERDADDVADLLVDRPHLVGHSYGGVVSMLAAARNPHAVRSLTLIEPPALALVRGNPLAEEFIAGVDDATRSARDPSDYHARFLRNFGFRPRDEALTGSQLAAARSSWGERSPAEADIPIDELRDIRTLVVRGDWASVPQAAAVRGRVLFHEICDVLVDRLGAESATFASAHNPQLLGEPFNERLRAFWEAA